MNPTPLYALTPVIVKPEKEGWYFVIDPDSDEGINCCEYDPVIKKWYDPVSNEAYPSHWLRPVAVPEERGEQMMTLDEFAKYFDKSLVFILRLKELYVCLNKCGISKGEWTEYNEGARRLVDSIMDKLLPNPEISIR